jgi:hypothetical protein
MVQIPGVEPPDWRPHGMDTTLLLPTRRPFTTFII